MTEAEKSVPFADIEECRAGKSEATSPLVQQSEVEIDVRRRSHGNAKFAMNGRHFTIVGHGKTTLKTARLIRIGCALTPAY